MTLPKEIPGTKKVALVTGANRGLGLETSKQLAKLGIEVILTSRNETSGKKAAAELKANGLPVHFHKLDVTKLRDIETLALFVAKKFGRLDVLVNNAGILPDNKIEGKFEAKSALLTDMADIRQAMETNVFGAFAMIQSVLPLMKKNGFGRIVNVSSLMGQLSTMDGGYPAYRISKASLNAVTRIFAAEAEGENILVNSVSPGLVKTDMGGPQATVSIEDGVKDILHLATLKDGGPTGGFFRNGKQIDW